MRAPYFFASPILLCSLLFCFLNNARSQELREWTIMVFMNGDNNLEDDALTDFREMAKVKNSDKVKIVLQFDRIGKPEDTTGMNWSQTLRYEMKPNLFPSSETKLPGGDLGEQDMGDGKVLSAFVDWAIRSYPANRYMLIIWDHGQGWRFLETLALDGSSVQKYYFNDRSSTHPAYKSVSHDETNGSELYNREIQDELNNLLQGRKIDLLGFDACLMSMVETAFAFRGTAKYMVASEELEPGTGWDYSDWLPKLIAKPAMNEAELAREIVNSYKRTYSKKDPATTLSSVNLEKMEAVASEIDSLASVLIQALVTESAAIKKMRDGCNTYAPDAPNPFYHIDMIQFCNQIISQSKNQKLVQQATNTRQALKSAIDANYFGKDRGGAYGSNGMAIYFPGTGQEYSTDGYEQGGYKKDNAIYPVEFVQHKRWADFLHAYFLKVP